MLATVCHHRAAFTHLISACIEPCEERKTFEAREGGEEIARDVQVSECEGEGGSPKLVESILGHRKGNKVRIFFQVFYIDNLQSKEHQWRVIDIQEARQSRPRAVV